MTKSPEVTSVNVVSQNMLLDKTRTKKGLILSQGDRIASIGATIGAFPGSLDIVGVQEVHITTEHRNGEILAEYCEEGPGFWVEHNQKPYPGAPTGRANEYMGLFGAMVDDIRIIEIGDNRRAILTEIAGAAFVNLHLRAGRNARFARYKQARELHKATADYDNVVLIGDYNEPPIRGVALARGVLSRVGFQSVYSLLGEESPATCPIEPYVSAMRRRSKIENHFVQRAWPIDDILVRGDRISVVAAGVLQRVIVTSDALEQSVSAEVPREPSDHDGVWATLEVAG